MCYRCEVCQDVVPYGRSRLLHVVHRRVPRGTEIEREWAVCSSCKGLLANGMSLAVLLHSSAQERAAASEVLLMERRERDAAQAGFIRLPVDPKARFNGSYSQRVKVDPGDLGIGPVALPESPHRRRRLPMTPPPAPKRINLKGSEEGGDPCGEGGTN